MRLRYRYELNPYASALVHVHSQLASRTIERTEMDHPLYDVVDYGIEPIRAVPTVMAYALKLAHAIEITDALNFVETMRPGLRHGVGHAAFVSRD